MELFINRWLVNLMPYVLNKKGQTCVCEQLHVTDTYIWEGVYTGNIKIKKSFLFIHNYTIFIPYSIFNFRFVAQSDRGTSFCRVLKVLNILKNCDTVLYARQFTEFQRRNINADVISQL